VEAQLVSTALTSTTPSQKAANWKATKLRQARMFEQDIPVQLQGY
jgi:hypothetical protein